MCTVADMERVVPRASDIPMFDIAGADVRPSRNVGLVLYSPRLGSRWSLWSSMQEVLAVQYLALVEIRVTRVVVGSRGGVDGA